MKHRATIVVVFLLVFALDCAAQSIADIARKERERQKQAKSTVNIATKGSQGVSVTSTATSAATVAAPAAGATAAASAASKPAGPVDRNGRDEKYWKDAFQKAREEATRAEQKVVITELKLKDLNSQLLQNSALYNREYRLGPQITETQKELEAARKEAEQAKQKIPQLEDELRRAGGLPGWAR